MELVGQEIKFKYRHYTTDKYDRSIFEVDDDKLWDLYDECQESGTNVSLFKADDDYDDSLLMVISNFNGDDLTGQRVYCKEYKKNIRFYVKKDWQEL